MDVFMKGSVRVVGRKLKVVTVQFRRPNPIARFLSEESSSPLGENRGFVLQPPASEP